MPGYTLDIHITPSKAPGNITEGEAERMEEPEEGQDAVWNVDSWVGLGHCILKLTTAVII